MFAARSPFWRSESPSPLPVHLSFDLPPGTVLTNTGRPVVAISPDGTKIVVNANNQLYLRRLDTRESEPIAGTGTGVTTPVFAG
jgi:hypothetical protein